MIKNTTDTTRNCILTFFLASLFFTAQAQETPVWKAYVQARQEGAIPMLPDFSYAGYAYSEKDIPDFSSRRVFNVTEYGAVPNDQQHDDQAIQAAIDAAEAQGGGVVFFPPGKFMVSYDEDVDKLIRISQGNILLKGSGSTQGGTEIFMDNMKVGVGSYMFLFKPENTAGEHLAYITETASRETFSVTVDDPSRFRKGMLIRITYQDPAFTPLYFAPLTAHRDWTRLWKDGLRIAEIHTVDSIRGNTVSFQEPLHVSLPKHSKQFEIVSHPHITTVGVEDILFTSGWGQYPEKFKHHENAIVDYAWNALKFQHVKNGWIRNCEFKDWNQGIYMDGCNRVTVEHVTFSGKKGHMSIHTRRGYGVLVKNCTDKAGQHHGPGVGYSGCATVYSRYQMAGNQNIDSHSGSPYVTLMDCIKGGHISGNGGPYPGYPHHAKYFVAWNMENSGGKEYYHFWPEKRNSNTYALPILVGLHGDPVQIEDSTVMLNENQGKSVQPSSLFEAQLSLRIGSRPEGVYKIVSKANGKCLTAAQEKTDDGANVLLKDFENQDNQRWIIRHNKYGYSTIISMKNQKLLKVAEGDNICHMSATGDDQELWAFWPVGDGSYKIISRYSGQSISFDKDDQPEKEVYHVQQQPYMQEDDQQWELVEASSLVSEPILKE